MPHSHPGHHVIVVNEGGPFATSEENAAYHTTIEGYSITVEALDSEVREVARFVEFTLPTGRTHRVPYERLVTIRDRASAEPFA